MSPTGFIAGSGLGGAAARLLFDADGVALCSASHPMASGPIPPSRLSRHSLERVEIAVALPPGPEIAYAYAAEFNDGFGPAAAVRLARERQEARMRQKYARRARYMRRSCRNMPAWK